MAVSSSPIVRIIPLFYKQLLVTDGSNATWTHLDLDLPEIAKWGPHLASVQIHTCTENRSTYHKWKIVMYNSFDGRQWNGPFDLFTAITSSATRDVIQSEYTTTSTFGLHTRLAAACVNDSGTAIERALCSAVGVFTFKS